MAAQSEYSVPSETRRVLLEGILGSGLNLGISNAHELAEYVHYVGRDMPSIAINWRFAESVASLKGLESIMINQYVKTRFNTGPFHVTINTDHAQLFIMSAMLVEIDPKEGDDEVKPTPIRELTEKYQGLFPNCDMHKMASSPYRKALTNIYKTKDDRYYHIHGSLNPTPSLRALGMPVDRPEITSVEDSYAPFIQRAATLTAAELDSLLSDEYRQAATLCLDAEEYIQSPHGQANADAGLYRITHYPYPPRPCWSVSSVTTNSERPLFGIKVVDLTRVIAGPSISRSLAELGASVMRVTAPHISDFSGLHPDLNWGKWNCSLDLRKEEDKKRLRKLIIEADVVIDGYRPGVFKKYGFGLDDILSLCEGRQQGVIVLRENCYGWSGPWSHRSGWQPISDANTGVSYGFGRAMGNDEPVTPVFPNSDYCTGIIGACAVLEALTKRGTQGGSFAIETSLNQYNAWLTRNVGTYPDDVWQKLWKKNGQVSFRHWHSMNYTIPRYLDMLKKNSGLFKPDYFELRKSAILGVTIKTVKPVLKFEGDQIRLGYNVGTRGNGTDAPKWPLDLRVEIVL